MDYGHRQTDRMLKELEQRIAEEYKASADIVSERISNHFSRFEKQDKAYAQKVKDGKMTAEAYAKWRKENMLLNKEWAKLRDTLTADMNNANKIAIGMINDNSIDAYALNMNYGTYEIESGTGLNTSFTLYDHDTVVNLMREDPQVIPSARLDIPEDMRWNRRKMTSVVTQGILSGQSIPDIAKRLQGVTTMNKAASIRNARTYTTAAENKGRVDSYERAKGMGIDLKQEWMATLDQRTRSSHRMLDGEKQIVGHKFSNGCRYPGDPDGPPWEIYNCRCTLVAAIAGFDDSAARRFSNLPKSMSYDEWKNKKQGLLKVAHAIANGKDITNTWTRREDQFAFEIEDVINTQGFDGLPRVVSAEEFDRIAQDTKAICKRGYNVSYETLREDAQDVLERYHEELIDGKWYVDCHVGGADYGQGMYSYVKYGDVTKTLTMDDAVKFYAGDNGRTEVFTFDKGTKIVKSSEIKELKKQEELIVKERASKVFNKLDEEEKDIAERMAGIKPTWGKEGQKAIEKFEELSEERQTIIQSVATDYRNIVQEGTERYRKMDDGAYAVLKGYDAIEADYDLGDDTHELVVLNRTKLIFRGE